MASERCGLVVWSLLRGYESIHVAMSEMGWGVADEGIRVYAVKCLCGCF